MGNALTFISWLRNGLSSLPSAGASGPRRSVQAEINLTSGGRSQNYPQSFMMKGPGEVVGFGQTMVARTEPLNGDNDFEPNFFPFVEFLESDFPWRYSIEDDNQGRLTPWLILLVLKEAPGEPEFKLVDNKSGKQPVILVSPKLLPNLSEAWAWAHVQISGDPGAGIESYLANNPQMNCSRLVCPRKLEELSRYSAFIVPVYEAGRRAGLGIPFDDSIGSQKAWPDSSNSNVPIEIPEYYQWSFQTSEYGDFEGLIDRLQYRPTAEDFGVRPVKGSQPGYFLNSDGSEVVFTHRQELIHAKGEPTVSGFWSKIITIFKSTWFWRRPVYLPDLIQVEGALAAPDYSNNRKPIYSANFEEKLWESLNTELANSDLSDLNQDDPLISLPVYGRYFQETTVLEKPLNTGGWDGPTSWVSEVNLDRRTRIAAAIGSSVVQEHQDEFMKECWSQVGAIREANEQLRLAEAANFCGECLKIRHFNTLNDARFALISQSFHRYYSEDKSEKSYKASFQDSGLPDGSVSYPWKRICNTRVGIKNLKDEDLFRPWIIANKQKVIPKKVDDDWNFLYNLIDACYDREFAGALIKGIQQNGTGYIFEELESEVIIVEPFDLEKFRDKFDEKEDLLERLNDTIEIPGKTLTNFHPLMLAPVVNKPMYRYLKDRSLDILAPGLGKMEPNTVMVLEENRKFIESYLVGLNHEMGREMVWREFPTDQRGTIFRYFWDATRPQNSEPAIQNIDQWDQALGRNGKTQDNNLALVVKGDLIRRYPQTIVFAMKVKNKQSPNWSETDWNRVFDQVNAGVHSVTDLYMQFDPEFSANLGNDILFLGFPFSVSMVENDPEYQYYFVFMEHASLPRFGLDSERVDPFTSWDSLAWSDLTVAGQTPVNNDGSGWVQTATVSLGADAKQFNDQGLDPSDPYWGADSAAMAWITYQKPVRILIGINTFLQKNEEA